MRIHRAQGTFGFTLVEIMIVVAVIGLLCAIALPNMIKSRTTAQRNACVSNLRVIDGAKEEWAFENKKQNGDSSRRSQINAYIKGGKIPKCPASGTYYYRPVGTEPRCTIQDHALATITAMGSADAADEE